MPQFLVPIDLTNKELQNFIVQNIAGDPGTGLIDGRIWYDSTADVFKARANGVTITFSSAGALDPEAVQDIVGAMVTGNTETGITVTYNDGSAILDFAVTDSPLLGGQNSAFHLARANHTGTQLASTVSDFAEAVSDQLGLMVATNTETGITVSYDDADNTLDFVVTDSPLLGGQNSAFHLARANHTGTQAPASITFAATDRILGRDTAAGGPGEELTVSGGLEFTGTGIQRAALTGDVTASAGSSSTVISSNAVTYAKMQDILTDTLVGRDTAATGDPESITVTGGIVFTGSGGIQTTAFTGDVTKALGGTALTIANDAVSNAKLANMAANSFKGNNTGGAADPLDLTVAQSKTLLAIVPADVAGFDTQVRTSRLDQMAAPTAPVSFNSQRITGLAAPTSGTDAANRDYVDNVAVGLDVKASVQFASTANVAGTYNATGGAMARGQFTAMSNANIDGVTLAANDRVLLKDQSTGAQNGIWVITTLGTGANGVWDRATDFDADVEVTPGAFTFVEKGTVNADSGWVLTNDAPIVIGGASGTALVWSQFSGAGQILAGNALSKTGNTLDVMPGTGLEISSDTIRIAAAAAGLGLTGGAGAALDVAVGFGIEISSDTVRLAASAAGAGLTGGAGAALDVVAGTGLEISADTVRIAAAAAGNGLTGGAGSALAVGAGNGITVTADAINVDAAVVTRKFVSDIGDAAATVFVLTHNLGTRDVWVAVHESATPWAGVFPDWEATSINTVTLRFTSIPSSNQYRALVVG